jgi:hypothetical protein
LLRVSRGLGFAVRRGRPLLVIAMIGVLSLGIAQTSLALTTSTMGTMSVGPFPGYMSANLKRANRYSLPTSGSVTKLSVYLQPTSTSGQQPIEGVIYKDLVGSPGALVATTNQLVFQQAEGAGWYDLSFPVPVSLSAGNYWIGLISGDTADVAAYRYEDVIDSLAYNLNSYSSGPANPFGSVSTDDRQLSLYATYIPLPVNTSAPVISGTPRVGHVLTASTGGWSGNPTGYTYIWQRCASSCEVISGAVSSSYSVQSADLGYTLRVLVTASNSAGFSPPAASALTTAITNTQCSLFASPGGSDVTGTGSLASPFQSVVKLDSALAAGQTGCLLEGTYGSTSTEHRLTKNGTSTGQVTITSYPGQTATVVGWVNVEGAYTTLSHLRIDGSNTFYTTERANTTCPHPVSQGLVLAGASDVLEYNDYYQSVPSLRGNGIGIGWWGTPDNAVVRFNKIHDTGQCDQYDHTIYLAHGNNVQVYDNWLWNNHGGQSFSTYPGATNTKIYDNVLDSSDSGFTIGDNGSSSVSGTAIYHNVVSNMTTLTNRDTGLSMPGVLISCDFISTASTGNQVYTDDSYNNLGGISTGCSSTTAHISLSAITTANPQYVDPANHDYAVEPSSPLADWGLWNGN